MSDNSTNTAMENEFEVISSEENIENDDIQATEEFSDAVAEPIFEQAGAPVECSDTVAEPIYEQVKAPEEAPKKKVTVKDIFRFIQNKIFTSKVCNIILISLSGLITALCLLQMLCWGLNIKEIYLNLWKAISTWNYIIVAVAAVMILFVIVLLVHTIKSIISLAKKGHRPRFSTVSTMFAFYIFSIFVSKIFGGTLLANINFDFNPILTIITVLVINYAFVRLFLKDFGARIFPFAFSLGAIALAIVMFNQNIGDFATFSMEGNQSFRLSELNIYRYIQAIRASQNSDVIYNLESAFLEYGEAINIGGTEFNEDLFVVLLQFISIMVANVLPFAAISLLGYFLFCLVDRNYIQYYNLQNGKKISIMMLVVSIMSLISNIALYFAFMFTDTGFEVQLDYTNIVLTIVLLIVMIVLTALPWKIYNIAYKRHYNAYKKSEGDR